jgi:hypothetical protein
MLEKNMENRLGAIAVLVDHRRIMQSMGSLEMSKNSAQYTPGYRVRRRVRLWTAAGLMLPTETVALH